MSTAPRIDYCFGCKHARAQFDQGPSGRMMVSCSSPQKPKGALREGYYQDLGDREFWVEHITPPWSVEEKYEGCELAEPLKFDGPFAQHLENACASKAKLFKQLDEAGELTR